MPIGGDLVGELHRFREIVGQHAPDALDGLARVLVAAGQLEAADRVWGWADQADEVMATDAV